MVQLPATPQFGVTMAMDNAIIPMLSSMEANGIYINQPRLRSLGDEFQVSIDNLRYEIRKHAWPDYNPDSPQQVSKLLFDQLGLPHGRRTAGGGWWETDDGALEKINHLHPVVPLQREFKGLSKLKGTFVDGILAKIDAYSRLHTNLNHATVVSGRLSSSDPNLQNIPSTGIGKKIRLSFCAEPGKILGVYDESQIELRVLADFSQDPTMVQAYLNGEDLHSKTGHVVGGYPTTCDKGCKPFCTVPKDFRTACKRFNFGMAYGITDEGLKDQLASEGIYWTVEQVAAFRKEWFGAYPQVRHAMDVVWDYTRKHGYVVDIWGRPRLLPGIWSDQPRIKNEAERQAFNHVIQGGAAGIIKLTMARLWKEMPLEFIRAGVKWILQVHDELIAELPDDKELCERFEKWVLGVFSSTVRLSIPVFGDGKMAYSWGEAK